MADVAMYDRKEKEEEEDKKKKKGEKAGGVQMVDVAVDDRKEEEEEKQKGQGEEKKQKKSMEEEEEEERWRAHMANIVNQVEVALEQALPLRQPFTIHHAMRYSLLANGKRVCPFLCISACQLSGGPPQLAMPTACALEMVHTASLIHDDLPCMDDGELRRGQPANHKVFGEDLAVLAGDALYANGVELIARHTEGVAADKLLGVITELSRAVGSEGMVAGQFLDLANERNPNLDLQTLEDIHVRKTAVLAECSTVCGAILGGAKEEEVEMIRQYGRTLGLLYQVVDDILDVTKSSEELGKTPGKDLLANKATYPKLLGLEKSREFAEQLRRRAQEHLSKFDQEKASPLLFFVDFVVDRLRQSKHNIVSCCTA